MRVYTIYFMRRIIPAYIILESSLKFICLSENIIKNINENFIHVNYSREFVYDKEN